ncbi:pilus assembly protein [Paenarthrobacter sp. Z7-10]|uniref:TadE/TadG family type IV pilus assembly protein n=1 Tax=Paenarthrobacter sp. Z7-10 TaxID=2787635 RepID=UPI0022A96D1B|nr:TadE family protein [Paenarthrobacter sp. Z7-10]MCZ2403915.1 pilus assembly protein [Paenarthrobacter sp. Z7-10]
MNRRAFTRASRDESGSAVVDFVLVSALLTTIFLATVQLALVLHIRNTVTDAAASGARYGALADRSPADAKDRTQQLLMATLGPDYAGNVRVTEEVFQGIRTLKVSVRSPLPVLGLMGPAAAMEISGHAALQP